MQQKVDLLNSTLTNEADAVVTPGKAHLTDPGSRAVFLAGF